MNKRLLFKLSIDLLMFLMFLLLITYPLSMYQLHELLGMVFIILLAIHNMVNWRWYKSLLKGKYHLIRFIHTLINLIMLGLILVNIISALGISLWLFTFMPFDWGITGRQWHIMSAYWGMILLAIHIGFHWDMLMNIVKKIAPISPPTAKITHILRIVTLFITGYGFYAAFKLEIGIRLLTFHAYFFIEQDQSYFEVAMNYLAFFAFCIAISHYSLKILRYAN